MTEKKDIDKAELTTALTDTETGSEGLSKEEDRKKSIQALEAMHAQGLIPEDVFEKKMADLKQS